MPSGCLIHVFTKFVLHFRHHYGVLRKEVSIKETWRHRKVYVIQSSSKSRPEGVLEIFKLSTSSFLLFQVTPKISLEKTELDFDFFKTPGRFSWKRQTRRRESQEHLKSHSQKTVPRTSQVTIKKEI